MYLLDKVIGGGNGSNSSSHLVVPLFLSIFLMNNNMNATFERPLSLHFTHNNNGSQKMS